MASSTPSQPRLLAIIELQNAIAAAAMTVDEVMRIVAERACALLAASAATVALVESEELVVRAVAGAAVGEPGADAGAAHRILEVGRRIPRAQSVAGRCVAEHRGLRIDDAAADPHAAADLAGHGGAASLACVPLLYGETAVGALGVMAPRASAFSDEDVETLRVLGQIIAIALHRAYTYPRPRYDGLQDALTGLGNRRAFDQRLDAELNRNRRFGHSFSLALVELEGLETAIDRLGQPAGDEMLRRVATILKQHTRMIDGCFRIGADELAIVMPGTSLEGAKVVAERCRAHGIESRACDGPVRLSFGVVAAEHETAAQITTRANAALTRDKGSGLLDRAGRGGSAS